MSMPPNPKLRDVIKICKSSKDVNFLDFFDSNKSNVYPSVRHRYNELIHVVANGISHLKLFTKFLRQILDAQQLSSDSCLTIIEQYKEEEPTLNISSNFVKLSDETSVVLPPHLQSDQKSNTDMHKKTDIDAFSDIFQFERNMANVLVMYWKRLNSEIYEPLYEYRKTCITKLEAIQEYVSDKYDKLMKLANKLRETKVSAISHWNDLCDAQHTLRKQRTLNPDSKNTKKSASKVKTLQTKVKKQFDSVVEMVDKFNNIQDEFWNEIVLNSCLQLESMEYSRVCFYQEYFDKYYELLTWRKAELENGEHTLQRAKNMRMTPFEINEYNVHPIRVESGNYNAVPPQQYELPCMGKELAQLQGKITEQRIDPSILIPVYNPFGEGLKPSTSRHIKSNYSRADSVIIHDRNISTSVSMSHSMSSTPSHLYNGSVSLQQSNSFFSPQGNAHTASQLFSRTNRAQTHNGGLPRPPKLQSYEDSEELTHSVSDTHMTSPSASMHSPAPHKPPPRKLPSTAIDIGKPALPSRSPRGSPNSHRLPPRKAVRSVSPTPKVSNKNNMRAPQLPPRRKTLPQNNFKRKPPKKNPLKVAEVVRKNSSAMDSGSDTGNMSDSHSHSSKKKSKKWKIGK